MREVKLALLEADVNFKVVKTFVKNVSEKCVGSEVLESLTPAQQVIKIVRESYCVVAVAFFIGRVLRRFIGRGLCKCIGQVLCKFINRVLRKLMGRVLCK